jgi:hypothetical protein
VLAFGCRSGRDHCDGDLLDPEALRQVILTSMTGQAPWQNGRRAWERLNGWHKPMPRPAITVENRQAHGDMAMNALQDIRLVRGLLDQAELGAVRRARECGKSWAEIGTMLGMARQSAWERYRDDAEPLDVAEG